MHYIQQITNHLNSSLTKLSLIIYHGDHAFAGLGRNTIFEQRTMTKEHEQRTQVHDNSSTECGSVSMTGSMRKDGHALYIANNKSFEQQFEQIIIMLLPVQDVMQFFEQRTMTKDHEQWTQVHDNSSPDAKLSNTIYIEPFLSTYRLYMQCLKFRKVCDLITHRLRRQAQKYRRLFFLLVVD